MGEMYGWTGKILRVDLSTGSVTLEDSSKYVPDYIGGIGIATKLAWDELKPGAEPYDPENPLMFMSGPLTGTLAPTSGKGIVCGVSPRPYPTPQFICGAMGGNWATELKYAGFDGVVIKGNSSKPVHLWIHDGEAEIKDAENLWGLDSFSTQEQLKTEHGQKAQILCIGPAGENLVRFATIQHRICNTAANCGLGATMGTKKLKAIAIRGTGGVKVARPSDFIDACKKITELISAGPTSNQVGGGPPSPGTLPCSIGCPLGCPEISNVSIARPTVGMCICPVFLSDPGWDLSVYPTEAIKEGYSGDIHFGGVKGWGTQVGQQLQTLNEGLGMSDWFYVDMYPWLAVCIDHGITEINGYKLDIDNPAFWYDFLRKVAHREGIGDIFADSLMRAVEKLNLPPIVKKHGHWREPAWGFSNHRLGRGWDDQPSPIWIYSMLHWAIEARDPMMYHHQSSFIQYWFPPAYGGTNENTDFDKIKATYARVFGTGETIEPGFGAIDAKTKAAKWFDSRSVLKNALLVCDWCFPRVYSGRKSLDELKAGKDYYGDVDAEAKMFATLTGLDMTTSDLEKAGEKIRNLDRALRVRNYDRSRDIDSTVEWIFEYPECADGTYLDKAMFNTILDSYYENRGWDKTTGWPTRAKFEELGLKDVADELESISKLP